MKSKTNKLKIVICGMLMCALLFACLAFYTVGMDSITQRLEDIDPEKTGDMDTTLWLVHHVMYALPVVLCAVFQYIAGRIRRTTPYISQREKFFECVIATVFAFTVLMPFCISYTGVFDEAEKVTYESVVWFLWQAVPLIVMLFYRKIRMDELLGTDDDK